MMRFIRILLGALFVLACVFAAITTWVMRTEAGTRFLIAQVNTYMPEIELVNISGTLVGGISADQFAYELPDVSLQASALFLQVDLWSLLGLEAIDIRQLRIKQLQVTLTPSEEPQKEKPLSIALPGLPIRLVVTNATVEQLNIDEQDIRAIRLRGEWSKETIRIRRLEATLPDLELAANLAGRVSTGDILAVDVQGSWVLPELSGRADVSGTLAELHVVHLLDIAGESSTTRVRTEGDFNLTGLPALSGQAVHTLTEPAVQVTTTFSGTHPVWSGSVDGKYAAWPFAADVVADGTSGTWRVAIAQGRLAGMAQVQGTVIAGEAISGKLQISIADTGLLLEGLQGAAHADVAFTTTQARIALRTTALDYAGITLAASTGNFTVPFDLEQALSAELKVQQLRLSDAIILNPVLNLQGPLEQLAFKLAWEESRLSGRVINITSAPEFEIDPAGQITLQPVTLTNEDRVEVRLTEGGATISAHCWQGFGRVCIEPLQISGAGALALRGTIAELPLAQFNSQLPVELLATSRLAGDWTWQPVGDGWRSDVNLVVQSAGIRMNDEDWSLPEINAQAALTDAGIDASVSGAAADFSFDGAFTLVGLQADGVIDAKIQAQANLSALPVLVPQLTRLEGATTADVAVTGSLADPSVTVVGQWSDGAIKWQDPEIELEQLSVNWSVAGQEWRVEGTGRPKQGGSVLITGEGIGFDQTLQVNANVTGQAIPLAAENWQITASPDIDLQVEAEKIRFSGAVDVPRARIEFKTLPNSLPRPSRDVRVVGRPTLEEDASALQGQVRVKLGDDVRLTLFGLDVGLKGQLDAKVAGDELTSLIGELQFYDGSLEASGQILTVEEGRIRFSGDPNTPYVDLLAVRLIEDQSPKLKVGVRISGRTDDLQTTVYSEPAMNETRALSFLVLGRDFNESSTSDGSQLVSAAIGLGIKQSQGVVQELQGALGLDELSALAADQNDVAIVAGKRLTKDLYVRYTYNAMSAVGALIIRYYLTERWRMEATNDTTSSMDLLYEFTK